MKFDKARNLVKFLLAMCLVFCVVGIAASGSQTGVVSTFISVAFFVTAFIVIAVYCKCPNWRQAHISRSVQGRQLPEMQKKSHNRRKNKGQKALKG